MKKKTLSTAADIESNIGLLGGRMKVIMEEECRMTEILMAICGIRILRRERDLLILTGGMRDIENRKSQIRDDTRRSATLTNGIGMDILREAGCGIKPNVVRGCGIT